MKMWGITNTGLVRSENQDAYAVFEAGAFHAAVVCDGMGGTNGGQVASAIAIARFEKELRDSLRDDMDIPQLRQAMLSAIACANDAIRQEAARNAEYQHMGTTWCAPWPGPTWRLSATSATAVPITSRRRVFSRSPVTTRWWRIWWPRVT